MSTHRALAERFAQTLTDHDLDAFAGSWMTSTSITTAAPSPARTARSPSSPRSWPRLRISVSRSTRSSTRARHSLAGTPIADATRARSWASRRGSSKLPPQPITAATVAGHQPTSTRPILCSRCGPPPISDSDRGGRVGRRGWWRSIGEVWRSRWSPRETAPSSPERVSAQRAGDSRFSVAGCLLDIYVVG